MDNKINIVGIGGVGRSGKDTVAEIFANRDFFVVSIGDIFRNLSRERHSDKPDPISRSNMTETSNWVRQNKGPDFAVRQSLKMFNDATQTKHYIGLVLLSVRAPVEADFILSNNGQLIWLEVSDRVRYERAMNNLRPGEPKLTFDEFMANEQTGYVPQPGIAKNIQMDMPYIKEHATDVLENNGSNLEEFMLVAEKFVDQVIARF